MLGKQCMACLLQLEQLESSEIIKLIIIYMSLTCRVES